MTHIIQRQHKTTRRGPGVLRSPQPWTTHLPTIAIAQCGQPYGYMGWPPPSTILPRGQPICPQSLSLSVDSPTGTWV